MLASSINRGHGWGIAARRYPLAAALNHSIASTFCYVIPDALATANRACWSSASMEFSPAMTPVSDTRKTWSPIPVCGLEVTALGGRLANLIPPSLLPSYGV